MLIIPAIDIKDGKCVRLRQGRMQEVTAYSDKPLDMAKRWVDAGARRLHLVDLDGAIAGKPVNIDIIHAITKNFPDLPIQIGGGIRNEETIQQYLYAGISYVIIGTMAITTPHFIDNACIAFPGHIIVGLDAKQGKLATDGWSKLSHHNIYDIAKRFENAGVVSIIFTDIERDGMLNHINKETTLELCKHVNIPIIASGGIADLEDIRTICSIAHEGVEGAITGRAIYEETLDFATAQKLADQICSPTDQKQ